MMSGYHGNPSLAGAVPSGQLHSVRPNPGLIVGARATRFRPLSMRLPTAFALLLAVRLAARRSGAPQSARPPGAAAAAGVAGRGGAHAGLGGTRAVPRFPLDGRHALPLAPWPARAPTRAASRSLSPRRFSTTGTLPARARRSSPSRGSRGAGWHLRAGLVAAHLQQMDQARSELALAHIEELGSAERGWHYFLQGMLADAAGEPVRAAGVLPAGGRRLRSPTSNGRGSSSPRSRSSCGSAG